MSQTHYIEEPMSDFDSNSDFIEMIEEEEECITMKEEPSILSNHQL